MEKNKKAFLYGAILSAITGASLVGMFEMLYLACNNNTIRYMYISDARLYVILFVLLIGLTLTVLAWMYTTLRIKNREIEEKESKRHSKRRYD